MIAQTQGVPNYLGVIANAVVLVGALYGFYKFAIRGLQGMVKDEVLPMFHAHTEADEKQAATVVKMLKKLSKTVERHDANFRVVDEKIRRLEGGDGHGRS